MFGLWASLLPGASDGLLTSSAGSVDFLASARLTGIDVLDARGTPVADWSIASASGTVYGREGVVVAAVAEPAEAALGLAGLSMLVLVRLRGRTGRRASPGPDPTTGVVERR